MRTRIGGFISGCGTLLGWLAGLVAIVATAFWINLKLGFGWAIGISLLGPAAWALVPWYALLAHGNWQLLAINYGSGFLAALIIAVGKWIAQET